MLVLHFKAPFGAFRTFSAGSYRQSSPFVTPSAAYGLLLGLAGIETRKPESESEVATGTAQNLPSMKIAVGMIDVPETGILLQQLHNYPIGTTGEKHEAATFGSKYNIQPIKREILVGLDGYVATDASSVIESSIRNAISGGIETPLQNGAARYGIPFWGDNSCMVDILEIDDGELKKARWYCPVDIENETDGPRPGTCRMPIWIDRNDMSKTRTMLFAPTAECAEIPESAWVEIGPQVEIIEVTDIGVNSDEKTGPSAGTGLVKKTRGRPTKSVESLEHTPPVIPSTPSGHERRETAKPSIEPTLDVERLSFMDMEDEPRAYAVYRALLGLGPVEADRVAKIAAERMRDSGILEFQRFRDDGPLGAAISTALATCLRLGLVDKPARGYRRAVARDPKIYLPETWDLCVLRNEVAERFDLENDLDLAVEAAAEWARQNLGLEFQRLRRDGHVYQGLLAAIRRLGG